VGSYDYATILATSQKINWRIEDIIGGDNVLDFDRPFMPESLAQAKLPFLSEEEQRTLNHIRAHNYLYLFGLVEEFILPFVLGHVQGRRLADDFETRAMLQFASEEAKHIHLFRRFSQDFELGFGIPCQVIGPPEAIAKAVLAHSPLGVALAILQIEWMSQRHYTESIAEDKTLDPVFCSLLRHHWMEEAQHAKLDTLMVEAMAADLSPEQIAVGIEDYGKIGALLDGGLAEQLRFDLAALEQAMGRRLSEDEREQYITVQTRAMRWTFLGSGMTHPKFLETLGKISPAARREVERMAPEFC
jgi:para-aminobenzoate N-oxygenase AurF